MKYWPNIYCFWFLGTLAIRQDPCRELFTKCDHVSHKSSLYYNKTESCYFDFIINMSYMEAKSFCKTIGTDLLTIFSHEEQKFLADGFKIGKEGRWLALEKEHGVWYWSINDIRIQTAFNCFNQNVSDHYARAITQYNTWKSKSENHQYRFICKSQTTKGVTLHGAHFSRLDRQWSGVHPMNVDYRTRNAVSCGNICLQVKCCSGFTFASSIQKCQLYQKAPALGYVSCSKTSAKCYVRN